MTRFKWTPKADEAALLVAGGNLTHNQIAVKVGVARQQLDRWKTYPEFQSRVKGHAEEFLAVVRSRGVAVLEKRVDLFNELWSKLQTIIAERAESDVMQAAPGGKTGLLVHSFKGLGGGDNFQVVDEFTLDTGLLKEIRELSKQAAEELGQWKERRELSGPNGAPLIDLSKLGDRDLDNLAAIYAQLAAEGAPDKGRE